MPDAPRHDSEDRRDLEPFVALEAATLIAGTGNGVAALALPWLTLRLTNDPAAAGVVVAAGALPTLVASLASGVVIDRLGRKRTSVGSDVFSAVSAGAIPLFGFLGILTYPLVLAASVAGAAFDPVGVTAREAMLPDVARRGRLDLERVNGVHEAVWALAFLVGPGVAGVLIAAIGAAQSFLAMFAGFVASAVLVGTARMRTPPPRTRPPQPWLADALDGLRFVWRDRAIRSTTLLSTISFTLAYSVLAIVLPVVYERLDQPQRLGLLVMAFSAGAIVGSLVYSAVGTWTARRPVFVTGLVAMAAMAGVLAFSPAFRVRIAVMLAAGFASGPVGPIVNVVLQERAAEEIRGRALAMVFALDYALFPVGYVSAGFLINAVGIPRTFALIGIGAGIVAFWSMATPALRGMERSRRGPGAGPLPGG
ncbi:MAG: MFS transporter [Coriobacteriia bacterium]|nr:MFS transporter [Coriobacteriia bacterium]